MPFIQSRFTPFYGYGNFDSIFYFAVPTYILLKFDHLHILRRFYYCTVFASIYTLFKMIYVKEYNKEIRDYYEFCKLNKNI